MATVDMSDGKAEAELLALIRHQDSKNFTLAVTSADGEWSVSTTELDTGTNAVGNGESFAEAWFKQAPGWARS